MLGLVSLWLAGCASPGPSSQWVPTGDPLVDGQNRVEQGPPRDRVLWEYRTASAALRRGRDDLAKTMLDDAIARLQGIYGKDPSARRARGYFTQESKKTFLGEPYERVMAYYYRGLLYWKDGELDNARACFRSAQFMDSDAEERAYANDYVLLEYLDGLATAKLGGDGSDSLQRACTNARLANPPPFPVTNNVLFLVELGAGPLKYATGQYGEELRFHPGHSRAKRARITVDGQTVLAEAYDDLTFQATTRGGRVMDHVLANKAVFKETTDVAGTAAIIGGAVMASQRNTRSPVDEVGAGLLLAGVLSKVVSAATTPAADTRAWESLPQYLAMATLAAPPGDYSATVEFLDPQGNPVAGLNRTIPFHVADTGRDAVVLVSDHQP